MLKDLIRKSRSYRRFHEDKPVSMEVLHELVDLARLSPSARNAQPLKYFLSNSPEINDKIFPHLAWAGYLKDWPGPQKGERPAAYIILLNDTDISANYFCDDGIASQSILLGAVEKGLGGCIVGSLNRLQLHRELRLSDNLKIVHVIALGEPKEVVQLEAMKDDDVKYWRDVDQIHHVPKRDLKDVIV
ncbi:MULTISPECIES: nitroreductase family protein [unclassified Carboxylicivirga]|uniref:nitroreductase family protein n=1 Tax=Carboxylicivirga TaxID=1628153 RepID=UPI003D3318B8